MNEKDTRKRREWVKNAAIVFLAVMLALTFFFQYDYELFTSRGGYTVCPAGEHYG